MRRDTFVSALLVSMAAAASALVQVGCQSYELDPVDPKAVGAKTETHKIDGSLLAPYVMLVVDRSGSMKDFTTAGSTKWKDLVANFTASNGFLVRYGSSIDFGLILFADGDSCNPGSVVATVGTPVDQIVQMINAASPGGSTPTAESLKAVVNDSRMSTPVAGRSRFVMLLTDGSPNCNSSLSTSTCVFADPDCTGRAACCLDDQATIAQVAALKAQDISTFVIGFGRDTADPTKPTYQTLDAAAVAGGKPRAQEPLFFQVNNSDELAKALGDIGGQLGTCNYVLNPAPASASLLQVVFKYTKDDNSTEVPLTPSTDYTYSPATSTLSIVGTRCQEIQSAPAELSGVEFRYVTPL